MFWVGLDGFVRLCGFGVVGQRAESLDIGAQPLGNRRDRSTLGQPVSVSLHMDGKGAGGCDLGEPKPLLPCFEIGGGNAPTSTVPASFQMTMMPRRRVTFAQQQADSRLCISSTFMSVRWRRTNDTAPANRETASALLRDFLPRTAAAAQSQP